MIHKFLLLALLAMVVTGAVLAVQSRGEIARYRDMRRM
ncbi:MAG: hypothetical protein V7646_1017 [Pseudonocardia sp.]|jgi:hypothetical protein